MPGEGVSHARGRGGGGGKEGAGSEGEGAEDGRECSGMPNGRLNWQDRYGVFSAKTQCVRTGRTDWSSLSISQYRSVSMSRLISLFIGGGGQEVLG